MIRYKGFKGFFIMKKDEDGEWEYMSRYFRRKDTVSAEFSKSSVRYFSDNTISDGTAWKAFDAIRKAYPKSKIVLYAYIDNTAHRVKYANPHERKVTTWLDKSDFYCYIPIREGKFV